MLLSNRNLQKQRAKINKHPKNDIRILTYCSHNMHVCKEFTPLREHLIPGNPSITQTNNILYLVKVLHNQKSKWESYSCYCCIFRNYFLTSLFSCFRPNRRKPFLRVPLTLLIANYCKYFE